MAVQSAKQFFLSHSATSNINVNLELILFPTITSSVTISDERREIKLKTDPTTYLVEKIQDWGLSWWLPGHDQARGNLLFSHHLWNMTLICSQETFSGFCQHACDCKPCYSLWIGFAELQQPVCKVHKICAHCGQIFHHTIGLTLVQIDGKLELEASHLFQLQCRTQQAWFPVILRNSQWNQTKRDLGHIFFL